MSWQAPGTPRGCSQSFKPPASPVRHNFLMTSVSLSQYGALRVRLEQNNRCSFFSVLSGLFPFEQSRIITPGYWLWADIIAATTESASGLL